MIVRPVRWSALRSDEAERIVKERAKVTANVFIDPHAIDRVNARAEGELINTDNIYDILRTGLCSGDPVWDEDRQKWKVIMTKRVAGGREVGAVTLFWKDNERLWVKTVQWMDR